MAFDPEALNVLDSTVTGFTLWHYRTPDAAEAIMVQPRYFNDAAHSMHAGDLIVLNAGVETNPGTGFLVVHRVGMAEGGLYVQFEALIVRQT